ncbi:Rpb9p [Malassezia vespertilionis]|uniref:DNA-directed RNA polymerase II subunit RPB9 n=1 Tax=Malassezia vespertilionis TaxID=2020962 RepID=A0A2N1JGU9_9BASI|nr:Rpb9p [Malassezia vespertilionis]
MEAIREHVLTSKADRTNHVLTYVCRNCDYRTEASQPLVFKNDLKNTSKEQPGVVEELMTDPTLWRTHDMSCPSCGNSESVVFQDQSKRDLNKMIFFYVCCYCNFLFQDEPQDQPLETE